MITKISRKRRTTVYTAYAARATIGNKKVKKTVGYNPLIRDSDIVAETEVTLWLTRQLEIKAAKMNLSAAKKRLKGLRESPR